jgi:predicted AAA+ superfamily ATPase
MKRIIKTLLYEWKGKQLPEAQPRKDKIKEYLDLSPKKIIVITGFRRIGKTYLLFDCIKMLLAEKTKEEVIYLNFEDERIPLQIEFLTQLLPTIKEEFANKTAYLFLDEIQNIPNWSKWLRRVYDTENIFLFVSGSNSKLSGNEIPTELRGRFLEINIFPLSFEEFLVFKKIKIDKKAVEHVSDTKAELRRYFREYLFFGGLPEIILLPEERKEETAQSYYRTVVQRDIIERFSVKNEEALKALLRLLLNGTTYTVTKLYNTIKSMQHEVGKTTLQDFLSYIERSYFLYSVPLFSYKIKEHQQAPRKIYIIDNIFIKSLSTSYANNQARLLENAVFLELLRRNGKENIFYWKDAKHYEVDFVITKKREVKELIQVCFSLESMETKQREIRGLLRASKEVGCKKLTILTDDYEDIKKEEWFGITETIHYIPAWKWFSSPEF